MNHLNVTAIAAAIGLIVSGGTIAQTMSKKETDKKSTVAGTMEQGAEREASLRALTQTRDTNYAVAKEKCAPLESGDQERCKDEAKEQYSK